ncbi:MAG: hypothetical protein JXA20_03600 [Spirochaetes bacterium]|nr:hypothetical protein [Spirochaetota bacterium]
MKHFYIAAAILLCALMAGCGGMLEDWQGIASGERQVIWQSLDGPAGTMNADTAMIASNPRLLSAEGRLFAAWIENGAMVVRLYGGDDGMPLWIPLPSPPVGSLNMFNLAWFNGQIHAITVTGASETAVYRYDANAGSWELISPADLRHTPGSGTVSDPVLAVYNGVLYALWSYNTGTMTVRMKRYDGGTTWYTGVEDVNGINDVVASTMNYPAVAVFNGLLVAACRFNAFIKVRVFNGASWSTWINEIRLTTPGVSSVRSTSLHSVNGRLYLACNELTTNSYDSIWVRDISTGQDLPTVADTTLKTGLRYHTKTGAADYATTAYNPVLDSVNGRLFITWREKASSAAGPPYDLFSTRCRLFSGDITAPAWLFVDGGLFDGLRNNSAYSINEVYSASHDSKIYVIFRQRNDPWAVDQAHVTVGY